MAQGVAIGQGEKVGGGAPADRGRPRPVVLLGRVAGPYSCFGMRITIENFGPIHHAEFDLTKDINVVFGKNNIGKSYAITAVYLVVKRLVEAFGSAAAVRRLSNEVTARFDEATEALQSMELPLSDLPPEELAEWETMLTQYTHEVFAQELAIPLSTSLNNSFPSLSQLQSPLPDKSLIIRITLPTLILSLTARDNELLLTPFGLPADLPADSPGRRLFHPAVRLLGKPRRLVNSIQQDIAPVLQAVYYLPASQSGLYQGLSGLGSIFAELSKTRNSTGSSISLPSFPEPVADYVGLLFSGGNQSEARHTVLAQLGILFEHEILEGKVGFDEKTKKLTFLPFHLLAPIDVAFASSMVAQLAPIVAFLKYILPDHLDQELAPKDPFPAHEGQEDTMAYTLLFIEEPEAHLHPEVQVKLMEFFAKLTKYNVRIIMTTHSNYLFNKLSNMVLKGELTEAQVGSHLMRATDKGSVMDDTLMKAVNGEGIPDENFVDVAEQLYNERLQAYEDQHEQPAQ